MLEAVPCRGVQKVTWAESTLLSVLSFPHLWNGMREVIEKYSEGCSIVNILGCCRNSLGPDWQGLEAQQRSVALVSLAELFVGGKFWHQDLVYFRTKQKLPALHTDLESFGKLMKNKDFTCRWSGVCGAKERRLWQLPKGELGKGLCLFLDEPLSRPTLPKNYYKELLPLVRLSSWKEKIASFIIYTLNYY